MSEAENLLNVSNSQEEMEENCVEEKSNPIIFARSETTHIPKALSHPSKLQNTVYQINHDGSLKNTSLYSIRESEEYIEELDTNNRSLWSRFLSLLRCFKTCNGDKTPEKALENSERGDIVPNIPSPYGPLLGQQRDQDKGKKTLVLDLDETLVHSTFQPTQSCQYIIPVEIEGNIYNVYVYQRPGALEFIKRMSELYEVIIYTASLQKYADPLLDQMDPNHYISYRLFRDHCINTEGIFVKDLGLLGRELSSVVMIDNAAISYKFQPKNGIECTAFIDDFDDTELTDMTPFMEYLSTKNDVRQFAKMWNEAKNNQTQVVLYEKK